MDAPGLTPDASVPWQDQSLFELIDTGSERRFDRLTGLVADILGTPICLVTLFDAQRAWIKSAIGIQPDCERPYGAWFCQPTLQNGFHEVSKQGNEAFFEKVSKMLCHDGLGFYAGHALRDSQGQAVGTLCVLDQRQRQLDDQERQRFAQLAELVEHEILFTDRLKLTQADLVEQALFDPATSLPRQLVGHDCLLSVIESADQRHAKVGLAVVHFIQYDEMANAYGEKARDEAMNLFSERLKAISGQHGMVSRPLPDRLLIARGDISSISTAHQWAERIYHEAIRPYDIANGKRSAQVAVGACLYPDQAAGAEELSRRANIAKPSQGGFSFYDDGDESRVLRRDQMTRAFIESLAKSRLSLVFQPIVSYSTGRVVACEALARWEDSTLGTVSPGEFIPIVEDNPMLCEEFTRWVLLRACQAARVWNDALEEPVKVNVNISATELYREGLIGDIDAALSSAGLAPELLVIEVTEQALIQRIDRAVQALEMLKSRGIRTALDDFGTGYSSLSYLRQLPLDTLKIDRSFIIDLATDCTAREVTRGIVNIGGALKINVVAEGVETEAQQAVLGDIGIEQVQGYLWHRPMACEALGEILMRANACRDVISPGG
ncbi:EAL domain, c-di-GMP-specific phosphodiesterase class I (or its enzymatically inactive variant) [Franzmannia pantelleriensis]|uniref:EAL domain, c-di-GMP-specific phosphodiesterase class I (Or its enzymatically inactive variant) n=2 Tax=Franzmannia pantelleriensis TaxID=48727 RepID=A0A1G9RV30_9GAMM|nr:EAL domain, c-di-GMP-specific phosphodiesterase class I (or its enzymatically inactive variant) [Halomonas pantelleriensis]